MDAYAPSQLTSTRLIDFAEPRSTCHHWLSTKFEDQRVAELPSFAAPGAPAVPCVEAAVAGWFRARSAFVGGASTVHVRLAGVGSTFACGVGGADLEGVAGRAEPAVGLG